MPEYRPVPCWAFPGSFPAHPRAGARFPLVATRSATGRYMAPAFRGSDGMQSVPSGRAPAAALRDQDKSSAAPNSEDPWRFGSMQDRAVEFGSANGRSPSIPGDHTRWLQPFLTNKMRASEDFSGTGAPASGSGDDR